MTLAEMTAEWEFRKQERLGILCVDGTPTLEQIKLAEGDADRWLREFAAQEKHCNLPYKD